MRDLEEGRVYLEHLRLEHRHLHQALRQVQETLLEVLDEEAVDGRREFVAERLTDFRSLLKTHFREEEAGGCLEEAVVRVPRLTAELQRLEREHPQLLAELDDLVRDAANLPMPEVLARFCKFKRSLNEHESAENRVMAQGFGCNLSDEMDALQD